MAGSTTTTALAVYLFTDKKPLKRFGAPSGVINTQLKQGVNKGAVDSKPNIERRTPNAQRPTPNVELRGSD
jgi:hypothetical protein